MKEEKYREFYENISVDEHLKQKIIMNKKKQVFPWKLTTTVLICAAIILLISIPIQKNRNTTPSKVAQRVDEVTKDIIDELDKKDDNKTQSEDSITGLPIMYYMQPVDVDEVKNLHSITNKDYAIQTLPIYLNRTYFEEDDVDESGVYVNEYSISEQERENILKDTVDALRNAGMDIPYNEQEYPYAYWYPESNLYLSVDIFGIVKIENQGSIDMNIKKEELASILSKYYGEEYEVKVSNRLPNSLYEDHLDQTVVGPKDTSNNPLGMKEIHDELFIEVNPAQERVGNYKVITYQEAEDLLLEGEISNKKEFEELLKVNPNWRVSETDIIKVSLEYDAYYEQNGTRQKYSLPYYKFIVDVTDVSKQYGFWKDDNWAEESVEGKRIVSEIDILAIDLHDWE